MSDDLEKLKCGYKAISAPPHLATRIRASVSDAEPRSMYWMPAAVTCTAILALIWVLPFTTGSSVTAKPTKPSMSALAALMPSKPSTSSLSMTQIRSVSVPRLPSKPKPATSPDTQTNYKLENEILKENSDGYI